MATQFAGGTYVNTTFTGAVRSDIQANLLTQMVTAGWTNIAQAASQGPGGVHTITLTIASPCVVTDTAHGFLGNERVILQVSAGGALPTGLSVNTVYFVKFINANTYNLSTTAGGSNINTSGSQSGTIVLNTQYILLQSATQANVTNPINIRLIDKLGNCIAVHIENSAGSVKSANQGSTNYGGCLLPAAAKTFRIIATKYQFVCLTSNVTTAREFVMAGMLYVPSFLSGVTDQGYMTSNCLSDTSATVAQSFRYSTSFIDNGSANSAPQNLETLYNSSFMESGNSSLAVGIGMPEVVIPVPASSFNSTALKGYRWANDDINTSDILYSSGLTAATDEGKLKGQFYDMVYIADAFMADSTDTFSGHTWWNLTSNQTGIATGNRPRGGVWVATS